MSASKGRAARLTVYRAKGEAGTEVESALLKQGAGMEGDFHAGSGGKQISLFSIESRRWMDETALKGLCFPRFRENITTEGIILEKLSAGRRLSAGTAVLEISGETKHCYEECPLYHSGEPCRLRGQSLFAKVVQSGTLNKGGVIEEA